jgi:nucleotide sugar dehydrogenase
MTNSGKHSAGPRRWGVLRSRFEARDALIGVIGLGYVGLPVATSLAEAGFRVLAVDNSQDRVKTVDQGASHIRDVSGDRIAALRAAGRLDVSMSYRGLAAADAVLICVPTPIFEGVPDLSAIKASGRALGEVLTPDTLVVLESTSYPGTTEEVLQPLLEIGGLAAGSDFLLAFSPERIDPGNPHYAFEDIPKVVGGVSQASTRAAETLYSQIVPKVTAVSGTREAEMAKLLENTFRHVNIALVNELALYAHDLGIDIWEAIEAAATKPFGFLPFWPGPGWGGHCIPLDPSFLSWRVRKDRAHEVRFIELAHTVNGEMTRHVVERISLLLNDHGKAVRGARVLGVGVAYKGGTNDTRQSSGLRVLGALAKRGARVLYHDPLVPTVSLSGRRLKSVTLSRRVVREQDLIVVLAQQPQVDWGIIRKEATAVLDCCNAFGTNSRNITRL